MKVVRRDVHDEISRDGQVAVFFDNQVVVLSPVASAIWQLTPPGGIDSPVLADALVERFGEPPGVSALEQVEATIVELRVMGLLAVR